MTEVTGPASEWLDRMRRLNPQMVLLAFNAAIGGFTFGYDVSSISAALLQVKRPNGGASDPCPGLTSHPLSVREQEMITSFVPVGAFLGVCLAGGLNWHFGRRRVLLVGSFVFTVGAALMAFADTVTKMLVARIVTGVGVGISSHTVPLYLSECAPPHLRGAYCFLNDIMIVGGQIAAAIVGTGLFMADARDGWRWMLGMAAVPSVLMFLGFCLQPESPRWLLSKGREAEAREVFALLRGQDERSVEVLGLLRGHQQSHVESHDREFSDMALAISAEHDSPIGEPRSLTSSIYQNYWEDACVRRALALGCFLMFLNQCVGANLIMYYGPWLLERIWHGASGPVAPEQDTCFTAGNKSSVAFSIMFPVVQFVGVAFGWLCVETVGRCPLVLASSSLVALSLAGIGTAFNMAEVSLPLVLSGILLYLTSFGLGLSPVPWTVNAEIYPLRVRSQCLSIAIGAKWLLGFLTSGTYLTLARLMSTSQVHARSHPDGIFWLYALVALAACPLLWRYMVETRGLTLEQIGELFADSKDAACVK